MKKPSITVILPGKDVAPYVGATLTSLTTQFDDRSQLKVVAINDGSQDETGALMRHFGEQFEHFEVVDNPTAVGLASARNQGLQRVEGDYFAFIDGDDWMAPHRLEVIRDTMRAHDCDFVRTDHVTVEGRQRALRRAPFPFRNVACSPRDGVLPGDQTTMVDYPYAWAGAFHRRVIDQGLAAFPDGLFTAEDRPWIWAMHLRARTFAVIDAPAILYRRGLSGSLTQVFDRRQLDFIPAFAATRAVVEADTEAERFLPKLVVTTLAVSAHHLARARMMSRPDRVALREGIGELIEALPRDLVGRAYRDAVHTRRRRLAPFIGKVA